MAEARGPVSARRPAIARLRALAPLAAVLVLAGCPQVLPDPGQGEISFRMALPREVTLDAVNISGVGPGGATAAKALSLTEGSATGTMGSLVVGPWDFVVRASYQTLVLFEGHEDDVLIARGETTSVTLVLDPIVGSVDFRVSIPDLFPPANVTGFTSELSEEGVLLSWTAPSDPDYTGVMIRRSTTFYPATPEDGDLIFGGLADAYEDSGVERGEFYYYTAFSYDGEPNYASGARIIAEVPEPPSVLLVSDQAELRGITELLDEMQATYEVLDYNWPTNLYTASLAVLGQYGVVIWYASGYGGGRVTTQAEYDVLEAYIQGGGRLVVTGFDTLGHPSDPLLASLVRSSTYGDGPFTTAVTVVHATHPVVNGPFGSYSVGTSLTTTNASSDHDWAEADTGRGAQTILGLAGGRDKVIATELAGGGKVVFWNGNVNASDWSAAGASGAALPEVKSASASEVEATASVAAFVNILGNTLAWLGVAVTPPGSEAGEVTPNDPLYADQWHYRAIGMPRAWGIMADPDYRDRFGEVTVAVVDTGYLPHPDLAGNLTSDGYDFISDLPTSNDGDGIDPDPTDPGDDPYDYDPSWHGTHVSGTIAAVTDNGMGVAGVGWNKLKVMPLRVLGVDGGWDYDIIQAILYAAGAPNDSGTVPTSVVKVINMSLGGGGYSQAFYDAIQVAVARGITVVCAAGNDATSPPLYPARYDNTIAVSAVGLDNVLAYYSSYGEEVDFTAPGGDMSEDDGVLSTLRDGYGPYSYRFYQGTSMASPHVAGIIGLLYSVAPNLTPGDAYEILRQTAQDLGQSGFDIYYGYGLIDAGAALELYLDSAASAVLSGRPQARPRVGQSTGSGAGASLAAEHSGDTIIVRLAQPRGQTLSRRQSTALGDALVRAHGLASVSGQNPEFKLVTLRPGQDVASALGSLGRDPGVAYAEPNYRVRIVD